MKHGWEVKKLGEVCKILNGGTPDTKISDYWNGDILWVTPKDLGKLKNIFLSETSRSISELGLQKSSARVIKENSIILSTRAPIGHLAINTKPMTTNQGCRGIEASHLLINKYLYYFLFSNVDYLNSLGKGTTFLELSTQSLANINIPLPPLPEQEKIVKILDYAFERLDSIKTLLQENIKSTQELFDSTLNAIFTTGGKDWEVKRLGDEAIIKIIDGDRGKNYPSQNDYLSQGYCLFLNTKNVRYDGFKFDNLTFISKEKDDLLRKGKLERNDVILTTRGTIGNCAIYSDDVVYGNVRINSGMVIFRPNIKMIKSQYLFKFLQSVVFKKQAEEETTGAAQPQLPINILSNFTIPLPPLPEQEKIVEKCDAIAQKTKELIALYKQKLADIEELKHSLLSQAFAGELNYDSDIIEERLMI